MIKNKIRIIKIRLKKRIKIVNRNQKQALMQMIRKDFLIMNI